MSFQIALCDAKACARRYPAAAEDKVAARERFVRGAGTLRVWPVLPLDINSPVPLDAGPEATQKLPRSCWGCRPALQRIVSSTHEVRAVRAGARGL